MTFPTYFHFDTVGSAYDTVLFLRTEPCATGAELYCDDDGAGSGGSSMIEAWLDADTYYLFVDGYSTSSMGAYTLNVWPMWWGGDGGPPPPRTDGGGAGSRDAGGSGSPDAGG